MTTKYEDELQDIEHRMRLLKAGKKSKVHPAEIEHHDIQRAREQEREERTKTLPEILCRWHGEPKKWEVVSFEAEIGGQSYVLEIDPYEEVEGRKRLRPKLVKLGYKAFAEDWALWKWHTARGSEIDEVTDTYILDCEPPKFVWAEVAAETPRRGRPPKFVTADAH